MGKLRRQKVWQREGDDVYDVRLNSFKWHI